MGFFDKQKLTEVFELSKNYDEWKSEIDNLKNPDPKSFFNAAHNKMYLEGKFMYLIDLCKLYKAHERDYREYCIKTVVGYIDGLINKLENPETWSADYSALVTSLHKEALEYFARDLGIYNAVKAGLSRLQAEKDAKAIAI
jgi:hypothetical protein